MNSTAAQQSVCFNTLTNKKVAGSYYSINGNIHIGGVSLLAFVVVLKKRAIASTIVVSSATPCLNALHCNNNKVVTV